MRTSWFALFSLGTLIIATVFASSAVAESVPPSCEFASSNPKAPILARGPHGFDPDDAARNGCLALKTVVTPGNFKLLGFKSVEEVSTARVGVPYDIYMVGLKELRDFKPGQSILPLLTPLDRRIYPIIVENQVRSSIVVTRRKSTGEAITTNWGLAQLIRLVTKNQQTPGDFVVWIPVLNFHFLGDRIGEDLMLTPLADRPLYGLKEGVPVSAQVVFSLLAPQTRAHDESNPG